LHCFEQALRRDDVAARVHGKVVAEARTDAGLAGEGVDDTGSVEQRVERRPREVRSDELEPALKRPAEVLLLAPGVVVVGQSVDPARVPPPSEQLLAEVRADEAGGSGDDDATHAAVATSSVWSKTSSARRVPSRGTGARTGTGAA